MSKVRVTQPSKLPKSKAKNAYDLLSEVRALILEEPKRYTQARFIARVGGLNGADDLSHLDDLRRMYTRVPLCGTVGCVAGWVATLKKGAAFHYSETMDIASRVLGLSFDQSRELFGASVLGRVAGRPQTKPYAKLGADHIRAFQAKYADQLKAQKVKR